MTDFMECDSCRAKPGSPTLCAGCLHNRQVIYDLKLNAVNLKAMRYPQAGAPVDQRLYNDAMHRIAELEGELRILRGVELHSMAHPPGAIARIASRLIGKPMPVDDD